MPGQRRMHSLPTKNLRTKIRYKIHRRLEESKLASHQLSHVGRRFLIDFNRYKQGKLRQYFSIGKQKDFKKQRKLQTSNTF